MLKGITLQLFIGPLVPIPAPKIAMDALTDVSVTLNNFKQVRYDFTPQQYSGTNRDLIAEAAEPMAVAIANYMVDAPFQKGVKWSSDLRRKEPWNGPRRNLKKSR